jgi:hypothetical protein
MGPLKTEAGPRYIVAVSDAFTKQLRLATVAQKSATEVAEVIWRHWITIFGVPQVIVTNNGREFNNNLQRCLWTALGIDHRFTSPFYPRCNLQVERTNRGHSQISARRHPRRQHQGDGLGTLSPRPHPQPQLRGQLGDRQIAA